MAQKHDISKSSKKKPVHGFGLSFFLSPKIYGHGIVDNTTNIKYGFDYNVSYNLRPSLVIEHGVYFRIKEFDFDFVFPQTQNNVFVGDIEVDYKIKQWRIGVPIKLGWHSNEEHLCSFVINTGILCEVGEGFKLVSNAFETSGYLAPATYQSSQFDFAWLLESGINVRISQNLLYFFCCNYSLFSEKVRLYEICFYNNDGNSFSTTMNVKPSQWNVVSGLKIKL